MLRVNLTCPFLATKRTIPPMLEGGSGIVSTSLLWAGSGEQLRERPTHPPSTV